MDESWTYAPPLAGDRFCGIEVVRHGVPLADGDVIGTIKLEPWQSDVLDRMNQRAEDGGWVVKDLSFIDRRRRS